MRKKWNYPGSRWWRFDFHTHTPASNDYGRGDESYKSITPDKWLQAAMKTDLDCVVVTDHNSGEWIDKINATYAGIRDNDSRPDWFREITIFPGVEMTVADSSSRVHLLAVFNPSCNSREITAVLGSCGIITGHGDDQFTSTTTGFIETVKKIKEAGGIAIPAHIDGKKGLLEHKSSLTPELGKSLKSVFAAEFCDMNTFDSADPPLRKIVDSLAKLAGSDAHKPEEIGRNSCWLKMTSPSIEGLRLALQDHEYCLKHQSEDPNTLSDIFITTLTIESMSHCGRIPGQPFILKFHPHFNSVIGGRGSGKSTILESIRIASRRIQGLAGEAPRVKHELDRFMNLSKNKGVMLDETELLLNMHRRGKEYRLRWRFDGQGSVLEEQDEQGWSSVDAGDLQDRFPVNIYSQKQINELAANPKGLLEIIDRSPEVNRPEWNRRWESKKSHFLQLKEKQRELDRRLSDEQQLKARLQDVENDLKQYEEKGHGDILKQYQKRSQQKNALPADQIFDDLSADIRDLVSSTELSDFPIKLFAKDDETTSEISSIHKKSTAELEKIGKELNCLADAVDNVKKQRASDIAESKWYSNAQESSAAYNKLVEEYEDKDSELLSLYGEWVQQRNHLQQQLKQLTAVRQEMALLQRQIEELCTEFLELRHELLGQRRIFLNKIVGTSDFVRMEVVPFGDITTLEEEYRALLNLDDGKFISSIYDGENTQGLLWRLVNWEGSKVSDDELFDLIVILKRETKAIAMAQVSGNHGAFDKRLYKLLESQPVVFDQLDCWWPEDMLRVKYSKNPAAGKFEDLEKGSAGQKAAAILAFLLSYGSEPLIIDQPEDDLDNALIYDLIVNKIHENKNRRQIIMVTHNPNIVVNGDAELVHVLKFTNGQVQLSEQGGLEEESIRDAICTIMEGGRTAFSKRYKRIILED